MTGLWPYTQLLGGEGVVAAQHGASGAWLYSLVGLVYWGLVLLALLPRFNQVMYQ